MRIVFVNLHTNEFLVKSASKYLFKQSIAIKHKYILDYLLNETNIEVCSYINKNGTSIAHNLPSLLMKILCAFRYMESKWVLKKNGIEHKITILKKIDDIKRDDIIILHQLQAAYFPEMEQVNSFKVMSLIHFFGSKSNSDAIKKSAPHLLMNEGDLKTHCELFKKYYNWYDKEFLVFPFVFENRFQRTKPFKKRQNKVFSTGTITYRTHSEHLEIYGNSCLQPMRKYVKDHKEELQELIDCYNSDYSENANKKFSLTGHENKCVRIIKSIYYKFFASQQKSYYSFNMVEKFNDYKMCLIGEEILSIPGIGFTEGMACGCAYIGRIGLYEDYGMKAGIHYIGYNGTPEDLIAKIQYYQKPEHQNELEQIAENGYQFAVNNFKGEIVAKRLIDELKIRQQEFLSNTNY